MTAIIALTRTELKLLSRERVRAALPAAVQGSMPTALQLGTMAAWTVAFALAAAKLFRWE